MSDDSGWIVATLMVYAGFVTIMLLLALNQRDKAIDRCIDYARKFEVLSDGHHPAAMDMAGVRTLVSDR